MSGTEPVAWLFTRFVLHYGAARMATFWGPDPAQAHAARDYWRSKVGHLSAEQVRHTLEHLPDHPPTVDEFLAIARRAPLPAVSKLGAPYPDAAARTARRAQLRAFRLGVAARFSGDAD